MKTSWDLTHIFKTKEEWEIAKEDLIKKISIFKKMLKKMLKNEENIKEIIEQKIKLDQKIEALYCYPKRYTDLNLEDKEHKSMQETAWNIYEEIIKLENELISTLNENQNLVQNFTKKYPYYKRYIRIIQKEQLPPPNKELENIKEIYRTLTQKDIDFGTIHDEEEKEIKLTRENYISLMMNEKEQIRKETLKKRNEGYQKMIYTLALLLNQKYQLEIKRKEKNKTLQETILTKQELPENIIKKLLEIAYKSNKIYLKYLNLKKEILKKEKLYNYDTSLPLGLMTIKNYELEDGINKITKSLSMLGEIYQEKIKEAFKNGWIDIYPSKNKRKMSYSCISYVGVPYALVNYTKKLNSVRTLTHELAHSIHTSFSKENPYEYFEYSLFISEIVSKVNEILLNEYILSEETEQEEKIYLLNDVVSSLINTLFGQPMFTEIEDELIKRCENQEILTANIINDIYQKIYIKYHKDAIQIEVDNKVEWACISHLFINDPYYLYQYPIGVSIALEIVKKLKEEKNFDKKYMEFLKIGNTKNIIDSLKMIDIDLQETKYIENAYIYLEKHIKELEKLTKIRKKVL